MKDITDQPADSLLDPYSPRSSRVILDALNHAEKEFRDYNNFCTRVDQIYSARTGIMSMQGSMGMGDQEYDTFWASMEVLKPAIYAKAPQIVAKPRFSDASAADKVVAELLERVVNSEFERNGIDMHMREVRDDLALNNRGVLWVSYESKDGRKSVCVDHVDRLDYRHEPVRYWPELGWQARRAWMTEKEMRARFKSFYRARPDGVPAGIFATRSNWDEDTADESAKAAVWEVWSKADDRVYWVTEGVDEILDEDAPHLSLRDFYPSPRPAYGTVKRRSLVPIPDYVRYETHLDQINTLTRRIYALLEQVKLRGLVPSGGDIGDAVQTAMASNDDMILIPVPGAAMMQGGGDFVQWVPLDMVANAITGLIAARTQLFSDFDRLSGISDIMRGETEAQETLGAQRIKTQYGSVRVKDKTEEIIRLARDAARVAVEVICDKFDRETLLDISQMTIPERKEVEGDIEEIRKAAKAEMEALTKKAQETAQEAGPDVDPAQAQQAFQQGQQAIAEKYAPRLAELSNTVVIEDVMDIIKDRRDRALIIDIETDSTVMVDEMAEKQTRSEMFQAVTGSFGALPQFAAMGDQGIKLFGALVNFTLQPYTRGNRMIQAQLDELIENAPDIAAKMKEDQGEGDSEGLVEAQKELAKAETLKGQAAMQSAQAKAQLDQANTQLKMAQMQQDAQTAQGKAQQEQQKLQLQLADAQTKAQDAQVKAQQAQALMEAQINNLEAKTAEILNKIGLDVRQQNLEEYTASSNEQRAVVEQEQQAVSSERDAVRADRSEDRADRGQQHSETTSERDFELRANQGAD